VRLNPDQHRGVVAAGHCLISACPGSGKTRVLIKRAEHLLANINNRIAAVTFTKEAAGEISSRLIQALGTECSKRITTGTFHSIAMQQLNSTRSTPVNILNENQSRILLRRAWREEAPFDKFIEIIKGVEQAKATRIPPTDPKGPVARVLYRYQQLLAERDALDFNDLVTEAVDGMMSGTVPFVRCTHLLVDEFQDVDQTQLSWVIAHVNAGVKVTVVGDDDQSVYKFRHSLGFEGMTAFAEETDAEQITLATTYRCAAQIITLANQLIINNSARISKRIQTAETRTGIIERYDFSNEADEAEAAGRILMSRPIADDPAKQETAVILARTNSVLNTVQTIFDASSPVIPYYRIGGESIWSKGVPGMIRDLLGAFHGKDGTGIVMMMHAMHCSRDLVHRVDEASRKPNAARELLETEAWKKGMSADEKAEWNAISHSLGEVNSALNAGNAMLAIERVASLAAQADGTRKGESIAAAACNILGEKMEGPLAERLRKLDRRERDTNKRDRQDPRAIGLMTLHGSKGLEFDRVWIMGVNHGVLPHKDSDPEEERRLCYVGMTRAKTHLTMSRSIEDGKESDFFKEIGLTPTYLPKAGM